MKIRGSYEIERKIPENGGTASVAFDQSVHRGNIRWYLCSIFVGGVHVTYRDSPTDRAFSLFDNEENSSSAKGG